MKKMELKAKSNKIVCKCCFKILYLNIHDEPKKNRIEQTDSNSYETAYKIIMDKYTFFEQKIV